MDRFNWWWLSYADEEHGFQGVVILAAETFKHACQVSDALGLSSKGEVKGYCLPWSHESLIAISNTFRKLSKHEAQSLADKIDEHSQKYGVIQGMPDEIKGLVNAH